ncbi:MAG TPA: diguanylate cyclase [Steroidobacteraceae bacterium]|jgi:diguanylate cyclase (GGDEF)-like protein|nr:diguanylate cyclase [Steroidobacteraceae bacterium]
MFGDEDSHHAASGRPLLPRRFPEPIESDYIEFSLRVFRPGIRAWHTAVLCVAVVLLSGESLLYLAGYRQLSLPLSVPEMGPLRLWLIGIAVTCRATMCALAWRADFSRVYASMAMPLTLLGHVCLNAVFVRAILGSHPEFLSAVAVCAFGASFLSGLQFRQSLLINFAVVLVAIVSAVRQPLPVMTVVSVIGQIAFAMLMASVVAIALERSVRSVYLENRRVGEMASRDGLTGLKNRRAFDEHLRRVWQLAQRDGRCLAVMLIDVDFFKAFNDSLGHQAGDAALQNIANVVAATARRPLDLSARYGGEELAIILYDVSREHVALVAEGVQRRVEALGMRHPSSTVSPMVTVSTGAAFVRPSAERSPQGAILLADRGLYAAKHAGRNRFTILDREQEAVTTGVFASSEAPIAKAASG